MNAPNDLIALADRLDGCDYSDISEVVAALRACAADRDWRPIETAPRDGSRVLLCGKPSHPTHWMPLPEPPQ